MVRRTPIFVNQPLPAKAGLIVKHALDYLRAKDYNYFTTKDFIRLPNNNYQQT